MNLPKQKHSHSLKNKTQAANFRRCISSVRRVLGRISTGGLKTKVPRTSFSSSSKAAWESVEFHVVVDVHSGWFVGVDIELRLCVVEVEVGLIRWLMLGWGCG